MPLELLKSGGKTQLIQRIVLLPDTWTRTVIIYTRSIVYTSGSRYRYLTGTFTANNALMPHRPLRGAISREALLAAYSRTGKRKRATASASLLTLSRFPSYTLQPVLNTFSTGSSPRTNRFARIASHSSAASVRLSSVTTLNTSKSVFKP
ncbi:hypothetical protein T265_08734 [Opisthorchis viverrini]|uniref:Uncharacterized protein n=1 Tax=Opisthorchis viverrini TaxID=6198 RepID=A0A075A7D1_OPIVI|nr:hypothetical protein T265_08734 [Opisthorchis viverrini]KER23359.1 hypothetical protein T265_08734 [Opisthorchis viverrini]